MLTLTACFRDHDDVTESILTHVTKKTRKKNIEYFTDIIVTMRVPKDAVDADILVNNGGTAISHA